MSFFKKYNLELNSFFILLTSILYFLLAYNGCKNQNTELYTLSHEIGEVTYVNANAYMISSRGNKSKIFSFKTNISTQKFSVHRRNEDYADLVRKIKLGETIEFYFKAEENQIDIEVHQIEKGGKVILSQSEFKEKHYFYMWIALIAGIGTVIFATYYYILNSKKFKL